MSAWKRALLTVATNVEDRFDALKIRLQRRLFNAPIMILPYIGHGTREMLYLRGRVLEDKGVESAKDNDTIWQNLVNMYRRVESNEIRYAIVQARFGSHEVEVTADEEGFFEVSIKPDQPLPADQILYEIELKLVDFPARVHSLQDVRATGTVIVPPPDAQFGVISDIDDTVIKTNVLDIIKMARNTFLRNSRTRLPFEGVAAFYRALQVGTNESYNPIYYVSSSPWNLYDMLVDFFEVREIPIGPFFLKDLGLTRDHFVSSGHEKHKLGNIQTLLDTHPDLPFILIGDSSQRDPEIYLQAVERNPGRIKAIYIRDVTTRVKRDEQVFQLADQSNALGVEMLLVPDTVGAAEHALLNGFIREEAMMDIRIERTEDSKDPEPLEKLLDPNAEAEDVQ